MKNSKNGFIIVTAMALSLIVTALIGVFAWNTSAKIGLITSEINGIKAKYMASAGTRCVRRASESFVSGQKYEITPSAKYANVSFTPEKISGKWSSTTVGSESAVTNPLKGKCPGIWRVTSTGTVNKRSFTVTEEFDGSTYFLGTIEYTSDNSLMTKVYIAAKRYLLRRPVLKCS